MRLLRWLRAPPKKEGMAGWLLLDLLERPQDLPEEAYSAGPYRIFITRKGARPLYAAALEEGYLPLLPRIRWCVQRLKEEAELDLREATWEEVYGQLSAQAKLLLKAEDTWAAHLAVLEALGLSRLAPYILDDRVQEVYVDAPFAPLYLDHLSHGRCSTDHVLEPREKNALQFLLEAFSDTAYSYTTPSLKGELTILGKRLRLAVDLQPLSYNGFNMNMRKVSLAQLSLADLLAQHFLSFEAACFLLACLELGAGLAVVGPTGSGKTTLLNCLDPLLPPELRRLYIEDVVESQDLLPFGYRQVKLQVEPVEGWARSRRKAQEVVKALHKNPDIIILGEVQTAEHSRALFHALSAGVQVLCTFHASSCERALARWLQVHRVPALLLPELHLMVGLRREGPGARRVWEICEPYEGEGGIRLRPLYSRNDGGLMRAAGFDQMALAAKLGTTRQEVERRMREIARALGSCLDGGRVAQQQLLGRYWRARQAPLQEAAA